MPATVEEIKDKDAGAVETRDGPTPSLLIYVVCHDDESEKIATETFGKFDWAKVLRVPETIYFGAVAYSFLLQKEAEWSDKTYVGTVHFTHYMQPVHGGIVDLDKFSKLIDQFAKADHEVLAFSGSYLTGTDMGCFGVLRPLMAVVKGLPEQLLQEVPFFLNNAWVAKPDLLKGYAQFAESVIAKMDDKESDVYSIVRESAGLGGSLPDALQTKDMHHYPWIPFVMERLPSVFFRNNKRCMVNLLTLPSKMAFLPDGSFTGIDSDSLRLPKFFWEWFSTNVAPSTAKTHYAKIGWLSSSAFKILNIQYPCFFACCIDSMKSYKNQRYILTSNQKVAQLQLDNNPTFVLLS